MPEQNLRTEQITFRGVVQGVGFRPTVYRIAQRLGMKGIVRNAGGAVQLVCTGAAEEIDIFIKEISLRKPPMARIDGVERKAIGTAVFQEFSIGHSCAEEAEVAILPADIAMCDDCAREFYEPGNPRHMHPFISCTNCGPRYTIMERLPYDRDTTTMIDFPMCGLCAGEYMDPASRRYHAQTISCHDCGPQVQLIMHSAQLEGVKDIGSEAGLLRYASNDRACTCNDGVCAHNDEMGDDVSVITRTAHEARQDEAIQEAIRILRGGGVIALKGVGGYYLACTPFDDVAVQRLREIKRREQKPFAVMFRDAAEVKAYCLVNPLEEEALRSPQRPIVLLTGKGKSQFTIPNLQYEGVKDVSKEAGMLGCAHNNERGDDTSVIARTVREARQDVAIQRQFVDGVCNTSRFVGAFLPSFGLQYILLDAVGPLIMTSANISELPLITDDGNMVEMVRSLSETNEPLIGGAILNKRRIAEGLDDSVVRVIDGAAQLIRRSKGYVPAPAFVQAAGGLAKDTMIFAAGGHLKSAFALSKGAYSYLSRHIGDLDSLESEAVYTAAFERMKAFFDIEPMLAVCDMHPRYLPTRFAESLGLPLIYAQHHHAHIASVMAEHGLNGPVLGVAFDGTGYGTDGAIWGGEFLICEGAGFERFSHLRYVDMPGGDESMKDAWRPALAHIAGVAGLDKNTPDFWIASEHDRPKWEAPRNDGDGGREFVIDLTDIIAYYEAHCTLNRPLERFAAVRDDRGSNLPGGDESMKDARKAALAHIAGMSGLRKNNSDFWIASEHDRPKGEAPRNDDTGGAFSDWAGSGSVREAVVAAIRSGVNTIRTSSMGRLFDAVCAMLGIHYENRYEGECAIMLENAAQRALEKLSKGDRPAEAERLALKFHMDVAHAILGQCRLARAERGIDVVCLSGGVFQNKILMEEALRLLRADAFAVHYNIHVPPNDGGLALGQNYIGMMSIE